MKNKIIFLTDSASSTIATGGVLRDKIWLKILPKIGVFETLESDRFREKRPIFKRFFSLFRSYPENGFSVKLVEELRKKFEPGSVLILSRLVHGKYIESAKKIGYRVILDEHNVESKLNRDMSMGKVSIYTRYILDRLEKIEKKYCLSADLVICTSENDKIEISNWFPVQGKKNILALPNIIDVSQYSFSQVNRSRVLFLGALDYYPNIDAVNWFLDDFLTPLLKKKPEIKEKMVVVGKNPSQKLVERIRSNEIEVIASPKSVLEILKETKVLFVPLRFGSGTRLKILEALSSGAFVVSTSKGAEGLEFGEESGLFREDSPEKFVAKIVELYLMDEKSERHQQLEINAKKTMSEYNSFSKWSSSFEEKLREIL